MTFQLFTLGPVSSLFSRPQRWCLPSSNIQSSHQLVIAHDHGHERYQGLLSVALAAPELGEAYPAVHATTPKDPYLLSLRHSICQTVNVGLVLRRTSD